MPSYRWILLTLTWYIFTTCSCNAAYLSSISTRLLQTQVRSHSQSYHPRRILFHMNMKNRMDEKLNSDSNSVVETVYDVDERDNDSQSESESQFTLLRSRTFNSGNGNERDKQELNAIPEEDSELLQKKVNICSISSAVTSIILLNIVTIIWGTQHSVIKLVIEDENILTSCFSFARFFVAALVAIPFSQNLFERSKENDIVWRWGFEMGFWMLLGYAFQAIGLEYTTAQRSGFLLYLNVKFVPFFAKVLLDRSISVLTWASAATALFGTGLLSYDGSPPNIGDIWSIGAAACSAMFILRLEAANEVIDSDQSSSFNAACLCVVTFGSFLWSIIEELFAGFSDTPLVIQPFSAAKGTFMNSIHVLTDHPWEMMYLGIVTTALANYIQTKGQRRIPAEKAAIIYALDPVWGAGFANLILGEALGWNGIIGASLITLAAVGTAILDLNQHTTIDQKNNQ